MSAARPKGHSTWYSKRAIDDRWLRLNQYRMSLAADLFFSFRSPYSYLAIGRYRTMAAEWDVDIALRPVYPLAIREPDFFERSHPNLAGDVIARLVSGFVLVAGRQLGDRALEPLGPGDHVVDALLQRDRVAPAEFGADLEAVERIGRILAGPFGTDLDAVLEPLAEPFQDDLHKGPDRNQLVAGDVIALAKRAAFRDCLRRARNVAHVDEDADRLAAAVELELLPAHRGHDRSRNDAIELLAGSIHIRCAREQHGKLVGREVGPQMHVAGGARGGVGRRGIEWRVLAHPALGGTVGLGRRDVDVAREPLVAAQQVGQPRERDDVGHHPLLGIGPALADHALRGEIDDVRRPLRS